MNSRLILAALALSALPLPARSQSTAPVVAAPSRLAVSLDAGTTGVGASLWITASRSLTFTLGYGGLDLDDTYSTDDADFDGRADLSNAHALLNWHPFGGGFHVSGGAVLARNRVDVTAVPEAGATYELNGTTYPAALVGTVSGGADLADGLAPYAGLGWSKSPAGRGFGLFITAGVLFSGSIATTLTADGPLASDPTFQANLEQERQDLQDELDRYEIFPVVRVGLMFRF